MEVEGLALDQILDNLTQPRVFTSEVAVQTDPIEFGGRARNGHAVLQPPFIIRKSSTRRLAETLKRLTQRNERIELISKENLPLSLARNSFHSERSFVIASRVSLTRLRDGGKDDSQADEAPRTLGGTSPPSPKSESTDRLISKGQALDEEVEDLDRVQSTTRTPHSINISDLSRSPIRSSTNWESSHPTHPRLSHASFSSSPTLDETVLDALDNALRAEETFQREKQHLQSVARHQSQTIESLLVDKEVLSLEVTRLTGLVELLARDHNLLNERIEQAERAFDRSKPLSDQHLQPTHHGSADETLSYFTAAGGDGSMMMIKDEDDRRRRNVWKSPVGGVTTVQESSRTRSSNPIEDLRRDHHRRRPPPSSQFSETDDGVMAGGSSLQDSDDLDDLEDGDSLCDPEQACLMIIDRSCPPPPPPASSPSATAAHRSPIPGSYPLLSPLLLPPTSI